MSKKWHPSVEKLLQRYCDEAQVRESLHRRAFYWYKKKLTCLQLPIIILSACSASLQFLSKGFPEIESHIVTGTACLSVGVSILSSVLSYLKLGELKSKHETSQVAWQSFHNSLVHQLNLVSELREDPIEFIQEVKTSYSRLFEISPIIHRDFMTNIRKRVEKSATELFQIPCYMNGFHHAHVWREDEEADDCKFEDNSVNNDIREEVALRVQDLQNGDD